MISVAPGNIWFRGRLGDSGSLGLVRHGGWVEKTFLQKQNGCGHRSGNFCPVGNFSFCAYGHGQILSNRLFTLSMVKNVYCYVVIVYPF